MQLKKRIEKLKAELLPNLERRKQQLLEQQQQPEVRVRKMTVDDYRWWPYQSAWIRKQHGIDNPWADATDRFWHKEITRMLKEKYQYTDSEIADYWEGRPTTLADRARGGTDLETAGTPTEPTNPAKTVATPAVVPATTSGSTPGWLKAKLRVGGWAVRPGNNAVHGTARQIRRDRFEEELNRKSR
jgi:hypothetical protein